MSLKVHPKMLLSSGPPHGHYISNLWKTAAEGEKITSTYYTVQAIYRLNSYSFLLELFQLAKLILDAQENSV
jgi:hypothetical protein